MAALAERGVPGPDGAARMIDQEIVREQFYAATPVDGTPKQRSHTRWQKFLRVLIHKRKT